MFSLLFSIALSFASQEFEVIFAISVVLSDITLVSGGGNAFGCHVLDVIEKFWQSFFIFRRFVLGILRGKCLLLYLIVHDVNLFVKVRTPLSPFHGFCQELTSLF